MPAWYGKQEGRPEQTGRLALAGAQHGKEQGTVSSGLLWTVGMIVAFCSGTGSHSGMLSRGVTGSDGPWVLC